MKTIFTLLILALTLTSCGVTNTPVSIAPISKDISVEMNKSDLYVRANNWMVKNFKDARSIIQFSDKEEGIVTGKYLLKDSSYSNGYVMNENLIYAIIKIQVKENATRITISPYDYTAVGSSYIPDFEYTEAKARADIENLIASYENFIKAPKDDF